MNLFIIRPSAAALQRIGWDTNKKLPVFIWIHGGGFGFGAGTDPMWGTLILSDFQRGQTHLTCDSSDPRYLVLQSISLGTPIISININYRLGIFGFAASLAILEAQVDPGIQGCNFGLRDQKVGLGWVSQNIFAFRGDPLKITIGGQSAGGGSTHVHVLDALRRKESPLFRHACIQSGAIGSTLGPISMTEAEHNWGELCLNLELQETPSKSKLDGLLGLGTDVLLQATKELNWYTFAVVQDDLTMAIEQSDPELMFVFNLGEVRDRPKAFSSANISVLIGDTEEEASVCRKFKSMIINIFQGTIFKQHVNEISNISKIRSLFLELSTSHDIAETLMLKYGLTAEVSPARLTAGIIRFLTDAAFGYPVACARKSFTDRRHAKKYNTEVVGDKSASDPQIHQTISVQNYRIKFGNPFPGPDMGVAHHCVELIYLFDAFHDHIALVDAERNVKENMGLLVSEAALVSKVQGKWISFVVQDQNTDGNETDITTYKRDKTVSVENLETGAERILQEERFALLAAEWKSVLKVLKGITEQAIG